MPADIDSGDSIDVESSIGDSDNEDSGWGCSMDQFDMQFCYTDACMKAPLDNRAKEIDYFRLIFGDTIMENLVTQINLHATQSEMKTVLSRGARAKITSPTQNWIPVTKAEIDAFIGVCILMAIHQLPEIQHYWSSDPALGVSAVLGVLLITFSNASRKFGDCPCK